MFINFFHKKNLAVNEIMWKDSVETGRSQTTTWSMYFQCWIPKSMNSLSESRKCVIPVVCVKIGKGT